MRTLLLDGEISDETWFGDEVTPAIFREELHAAEGDVVLWINSPGGDCFAAAQIYNMLMDYPGSVAVKIDGLAKDSKWIAELFCFGLVKGSFIPDKDIRILREFMRYRSKLTNMRSSEKNRFQNGFTVCNILSAFP